jgi:hypothetical protein
MDIEQVAHETPDKIFTQPIDINKGVQDEDTRRIAELLGFKGAEIAEAQTQMKNLYELFIKEEATQVEINPFVQTKDGKVYCVDAKILFDDNAAFRHAEVHAQRDFSMEDPREVEASKFNLNYIGLDGNIGCMGQRQHTQRHSRTYKTIADCAYHDRAKLQRYFFLPHTLFPAPRASSSFLFFFLVPFFLPCFYGRIRVPLNPSLLLELLSRHNPISSTKQGYIERTSASHSSVRHGRARLAQRGRRHPSKGR